MHGGVIRRGGKEAIVQEGALEDDVNQEVEGVPNEEDTQARWCVLLQGAFGEDVRAIEQHDDHRKGNDSCAVDHVQTRAALGRHDEISAAVGVFL